MERFFRACLRHRKRVVGIFLLVAVLSALCIPQVKVNADFSDYLPPNTPSTKAIDAMDSAFGNDISNVRVYVSGLSLTQAADLDTRFASADGVIDSQWLGDEVDLATPLELQDADTVDQWKDSEGYLFQLTIEAPFTQDKIDSLRDIAQQAPGADHVAVDGSAATSAEVLQNVSSDMVSIMLIAVITVLLIMAFSTVSYLHPVIALFAIGVAVVINMGTNIVQGSVSSVTQLVASVLQLAVSMDYSIVMLSNLQRFRLEEPDPLEAMVKTMCKSFPVVSSSAAVTFFGFLSLASMQFLLGVDMGVVLAKGIAISFVCITLFMPCLLFMLRKPVDKLTHRSFVGRTTGFARICRVLAVPAVIAAALVVVPAYNAQGLSEFNYGASKNVSPAAQVSQDTAYLNDRFGDSQTWVVMVPEGQWGHENALVESLQEIPEVTDVVSYSTVAGSAMPTQLASEDQISQLISGGYSRIVVTLDTEAESAKTFSLVEQVRGACQQQYGDGYYLAGDSVSTYDIKQVSQSDAATVRFASMAAIGLVLLVMFRSLSIPLILLATIETSIWINLAIPYFMGVEVNYVGFLVIDAVQLGAAVDYAIIYAHEYLYLRERKPKAEAAELAVAHTTLPILTSSGILMAATLGIYLAATSPMIQDLGMLIFRGALIAVIMIFLVLPTLFKLLDGVVRRTSLGLSFYQGKTADLAADAPCTPPASR